MTVKYHYKGFVPPDVAEHIATCGRDYPFPIEIDRMPDQHAWDYVFADRNYTHSGEDCMGQAYTIDRKGLAYAIVGRFLFLPDEAAHIAFQKEFPDLVVNPNPFTTEMS